MTHAVLEVRPVTVQERYAHIVAELSWSEACHLRWLMQNYCSTAGRPNLKALDEALSKLGVTV